MPLTLGILNADQVRPELAPHYGEYTDMFKRLLSAADPSVLTRNYQVTAGQYPADIDEVDGYIITGSKYSVYDDDPWIQQLGEFVRRLHARRKKLLAICFGHQLVAHALGGKTAKSSAGWALGVQHCVITSALSATVAKGDRMRFLASHQDQVITLAPGSITVASSDICPHVMTQLGEHILTLQWHPEFNADYVEQLLYLRRDQLGDKAVAQAVDSLTQPLDNLRFAALALDFIRRQ
jgi:GMP synthase-like glutamine amidotransferase